LFPTKYGLYVKVNDVPLAGVTVTEFCAAEPTLGVIVPKFPPSHTVTLCAPSKVAPLRFTVQVVETVRRVPLVGQPVNDKTGVGGADMIEKPAMATLLLVSMDQVCTTIAPGDVALSSAV
jgi:hypothetical protein